MTADQQGSQSPEPVQGSRSVAEIAGFCEELIRCLGMELQVEVAEQEGMVVVNLTGPDRPAMLSGAGSVLNCMEHLLNKVFRTGKGTSIASIVLDSDSYRQHREAELVLLAQMASNKVIAQQRPMSLQAMTPRERRIVHLALAAIPGVRSESHGEGENRSVTIYPA